MILKEINNECLYELVYQIVLTHVLAYKYMHVEIRYFIKTLQYKI